MIGLSVIIPAYNEAERIRPTISSLHQFLAGRGICYEIIVVDDGSVDNTVPLLVALQQEIPGLSVIRVQPNKGKGNAVRTGMLAARGALRIFTDADGSTPVGELDKVLRPLQEQQADISIGSRYLDDSEVARAQPGIRVFWSRMVNRVIQRILLPGIADPHCGFKAFTAAAAEQVFSRCHIDGWSFDLEVLAMARGQGLRVREVGVQWFNDERSKARISQLPGEIANVYRIRKRLCRL